MATGDRSAAQEGGAALDGVRRALWSRIIKVEADQKRGQHLSLTVRKDWRGLWRAAPRALCSVWRENTRLVKSCFYARRPGITPPHRRMMCAGLLMSVIMIVTRWKLIGFSFSSRVILQTGSASSAGQAADYPSRFQSPEVKPSMKPN